MEELDLLEPFEWEGPAFLHSNLHFELKSTTCTNNYKRRLSDWSDGYLDAVNTKYQSEKSKQIQFRWRNLIPFILTNWHPSLHTSCGQILLRKLDTFYHNFFLHLMNQYNDNLLINDRSSQLTMGRQYLKSMRNQTHSDSYGISRDLSQQKSSSRRLS